MNDLYQKIELLCQEKGVNVTRMCREAKIARGNLTDLKMGRSLTLSAMTLHKIAKYFDVTIDYLLGDRPRSTTGRHIGETNSLHASAQQLRQVHEKKIRPACSEADLKIALFGGDEEVTDEMWQEAKFAAQKIKERYKRFGGQNGNDRPF